MRINYTYQYQDFPGAPGLTCISSFIGKLTASPLWYIFVSVLVYCGLDRILNYFDIDNAYFLILSFAFSFTLVYHVHKFIRNKCAQILQKRYIVKVNALKDSNPAKYYEIMVGLQKRQNGK